MTRESTKFGTFEALADIHANSGLLTVFLVAAILFGIPRVANAGYSTLAEALYWVALGVALLLLAVDIQKLRGRVQSDR